MIHFLAYSLLRVPPFHWYYAPQVMTIILLGSLALGAISQQSRVGWSKRVWQVVPAICFLIPSIGMSSLLAQENFVVREMPIHSNWGTHAQYREAGLWLRENYKDEIILLEGGEIGTLAYYCDCRLLDPFSDRRWLRDYITAYSSQSSLTAALLKINFAFYREPEFEGDPYLLRADTRKPNPDEVIIKEWQTSTQWIPRAFLRLSRP